MFLGVKYATSGGSSKPNVAAAPPINASSSDEADFIKCANSMAAARPRRLTETQEVFGGAGQEELSGRVENKDFVVL